MRFVYADYVRLHHRNGLYQLIQQCIPFPLSFFGLSLIFFGLSLIFFGLPLPFIHRIHMLVHNPEHSHGQLREALQVAYPVFHSCASA